MQINKQTTTSEEACPLLVNMRGVRRGVSALLTNFLPVYRRFRIANALGTLSCVLSGLRIGVEDYIMFFIWLRTKWLNLMSALPANRHIAVMRKVILVSLLIYFGIWCMLSCASACEFGHMAQARPVPVTHKVAHATLETLQMEMQNLGAQVKKWRQRMEKIKSWTNGDMNGHET